jgi:polysaccharide pyruvyl transferase WcaK-like protein
MSGLQRGATGPVVVSGWYGIGNSGDEAILTVLVDQLEAMGIRDVEVLTLAPEAVTRRLGHRGVVGVDDCDSYGVGGIKNLFNGRILAKIRQLRRARAFIFGGGSILRDNTSRNNIARLLDDIFLCWLLRVPIFFYALGVGPIETRSGRFLIGLACRCATTITVRDERSAALVRSLGIAAEKVSVVTDPAVLLQDASTATVVAKAGLEEALAGAGQKLFVYPTVSMMRPPLAPNDERHLRSLAAALDTLCEVDGFHIHFIPMWITGLANDDIAVSQKVIGHMCCRDRASIVHAVLEPEEIRALTTVPTINLTIRLHAMIYAVSNGIPCVPLNYEPKVAGNAERFGLRPLLVEFSETMAEDIVAAVRRLMRDKAAETQRLTERLPELRAEARTTFTLLRRLLGAA